MPEEPARMIRIVLLDDHALFRESVARLLSAEPDFEVVATCGSVKEALAIIKQERIDIVLLDFDLGQNDGSQFMRSAREQGYTAKVLVVTAGIEKDEAADLIRSGVSGVFTKNNSAALLAEGIRDVMAGKVWFEQELLQEAIGRVHSRSENPALLFTERERLVLSGVFEGLANKEIAERISVSESSVKATLQQLFSKTGVRTRSQLVRVALEQHKNEIQ
ncbi:MAG TPA: response regulator transcription factor [Candidatus Saccharimonadales bacterium]|jgi:two-component system nitrate/nitrite response regulator NarL|nr:response regulator transcription factor [Candidatus Saccharimonadales bacterium]